MQLVSKEFCEENNLEIHPIVKLTNCTTMNDRLLGYGGYVEVNVQIPGRDFSEDHLILVTSEISHQKEIPVVVGTYFIASLSNYLKTLEKEVFDELDPAIHKHIILGKKQLKLERNMAVNLPLVL